MTPIRAVDTLPTDPAPADRPTAHPEAVAATGAALRAVLRSVASPVVVVTVGGDGETAPRGATIGSFASVSLDPPLVSFNVTHGSRLHDALASADAFTVHLLADDQAEVAAFFARSEPAAGDGLEDEAPRLDGTLGTLACDVYARLDAGDHTVLLGRVTRVAGGRDAAPLLYYRRSYRGIGGEV